MQNSKIEELKQSIDSLEIAITALEQLRDARQMRLDFAKQAIPDLQTMRLDYMLQLRAEQRKSEKELEKEIERFDRHAHDEYFHN